MSVFDYIYSDEEVKLTGDTFETLTKQIFEIHPEWKIVQENGEGNLPITVDRLIVMILLPTINASLMKLPTVDKVQAISRLIYLVGLKVSNGRIVER